MQNIKLTLQYDGSRYLGWKRPEKDHNDRTISYKIETVLEKLTGMPVALFAATRTEPGVHARNLTVNFLTDSTLTPEQFRTALNQYLPQDIAILTAKKASERFRADLNATEITYEYIIDTLPVPDLFHRNYRYQMDRIPDIERMKSAVPSLIGRHDFRYFSSIRKKKGTEKEIRTITFSQDDSRLCIRISANDFHYQMVPFILGTLLDIGTGKKSAECVEAILDGKEKPSASCNTKGLILYDVTYSL